MKYIMRFFIAFSVFLPITATANTNVVFIPVDDLFDYNRFEELYGQEVHTPNLDNLAQQGTSYTRAYTLATWCQPARAGIMYGLSAATHKVGLTESRPRQDTPEYSALFDNPQLRSIPEILSDNGYITASAGKVFHFARPDKWDVNGPVVKMQSFTGVHNPPEIVTFMQAGVWPEDQVHPDQNVANWGVDFIENHDGQQPFFLTLGFFQPHVNRASPQWAWDMYSNVTAIEPLPGDWDDIPAQGVEYARRPYIFGVPEYDKIYAAGAKVHHTQGYLASVTYIDTLVGQVLAAVAASPYADNTIVIVTSDHGYHLGEKFHWRKHTYWEQSLRIPLIIDSKGAIPDGEVALPVSLLDIAPTVVDLALNISVPQHEGVSLRTGRSPVKIHMDNGEATVSDAGMKVIDYDQSITGDVDREVYNLTSDEHEYTNLVVPGC